MKISHAGADGGSAPAPSSRKWGGQGVIFRIGTVTALVALVAALWGLPGVAIAWCIGAPLGFDGLPLVEPVLDDDGDGLNNLQEAFLGTDPNNPDTNGNGISDADEVVDGVRNIDRPSLFSAERYADPNDPDNRQIVVLEGTNLFRSRRNIGGAWVNVQDTGRRRLVRQSLRGNSENRIALRLPNASANRLLGELPSRLFVRTLGRQVTNRLDLQPMSLDCEQPKVMGAALIRLHAELDGRIETLEYIGIGGCGLVGRLNSREVAATVVLSDHTLPVTGEYRVRLDGPGQATPLIGSRILTPVRPRIVAGSRNPIPPGGDEIRVGDRLTVVRGTESVDPGEIVMVKGLIADLTIPQSNLWADHDGDGIPTAVELREGTDPLAYDTDRDGLPDGLERRLPQFDPNNPDTNDDGISDGEEYFSSIRAAQPALLWDPPTRGARHRKFDRR